MFGLNSTFLVQTKSLHADPAALDDLFNPSASTGDSSAAAPFAALAGYGFHATAAPTPPLTYTTFTVFNGGITFVLNFTDADGPTANFETDIINAAKLLSAAVHDQITVNLTIGFGEVGGTVLGSGSAAAGPSSGVFESYSDVHAKLLAHAAAGDTNFSSLPAGSSINDQNGTAQSSVAVWNAQLKSLGYISATATAEDGEAGFAKDISDSLMVGVGLHELSHALGRVPFGAQPDIMEFFRYTSPGVHYFSGSIPAASSYFSLDGGVTTLANYGVNSDPSDFLNDSLTVDDNFNEFYTGTTLQTLTQLDLTQLDVLGFNTQPLVKKFTPFDFNGDGVGDILWHNTNGNLSIWDSQSGGASFAKTAITGAPTSWSVVGVGDFNHDAFADILWHNTNGNIAIWDGNGANSFTKTAIAGAATSWSVAGVGDFNGDGFSDILWHNSNGTISLWNGNGSGGFNKTALAGAPTSWSVVGVGDFNGDTFSDILWLNTNGNIAIWDSNGSGGFTKTSQAGQGSGWSVAGVGDFNGDGSADILWRSSAGGLSVWESNGSGGFLSVPLGIPGTDFQVQGVADITGDHKADFLMRNSAGATVLYAANGSLGFNQSNVGTVATSWSIQGG